jgi:uncharacterized protein (TIGR03083 family)
MDDFERIRRERLNLANEMAGLTADEWNTQSLCAEWRVADVVAHVLASTDMRFRVMFGRLVKSGFNLDSTLSKQARGLGELPQAELVGSLRARADFRFVPPGAKPTNLMADTVVHSQDVRRPLGVPCSVEASTLLAAASFLAVNNFNCKSATRAEGLRLVATDTDWSHGQGSEVRGPLEAVMMAICGRSAALADLDGPGLEVLASRCPNRVPVAAAASGSKRAI